MRSRAIVAASVLAAIVSVVSGSSAAAATHKKQDTVQKPTSSNVTVQPGDNLSKIAVANKTTYVRLYDANTNINDPDLIFTGQTIRIPAPDEELASRPLPEKVKAAAAATPVPAAPRTVAKPAATKKTTPVVVSGDTSVWDRLAQCESGGNWSISTGNGFYGGLQFTLSSWAAAGGSGNPAQASREEQIARGQVLQARQGWGAWPACSAKLGLL